MSRSEDIARVLADSRLTPERVEAYLLANGWKKVEDFPNDTEWQVKDGRRWARTMLQKSGTYYTHPGYLESTIWRIADYEDEWWLTTANAILAHPLPGEEGAGG